MRSIAAGDAHNTFECIVKTKSRFQFNIVNYVDIQNYQIAAKHCFYAPG